MILPLRFDILLRFKAVGLMAELSGTDIRVDIAILEHFNRKTGRCDPSIGRIAKLLELNPRTVIRSINNLVRAGLLQKVRHGGHAQCNSYQPVWSKGRELESQWRARFKSLSARTGVTEPAPNSCQTSHLASDKPVTQTFSMNQSKEPLDGRLGSPKDRRSVKTESGNRYSGRQQPNSHRVRPQSFNVTTCRPSDAARSSAERRWNNDLTDQFVGTEAHAVVIALIDGPISEAATDAEMRQRGAGLCLILKQISRPAAPLAQTADATSTSPDVGAADETERSKAPHHADLLLFSDEQLDGDVRGEPDDD